MLIQRHVAMEGRMALTLSRFKMIGENFLGHLWFVAARQVVKQGSVGASLIPSAVEVSVTAGLRSVKIPMAVKLRLKRRHRRHKFVGAFWGVLGVLVGTVRGFWWNIS